MTELKKRRWTPSEDASTSLTVSVPAVYIVPGTPFAANRSSSVEFSSSFDIIFAATDGAAVPEAYYMII
jgi:hypothetical protein